MESNTGTSRNVRKSVFSGYTVIIYLFVFFCLIFLFYRYYDKYRRDKTVEIQNDLKTVAQLKVHDLVLWRNERLGDGQTLSMNALVSQVTERIYRKTASAKDINDILGIFHSYEKVYSYSSAKLVDVKGNVLLSDKGFITSSAHLKSVLPEIAARKVPVLTDMHYNDSNSAVNSANINLIVPVLFDNDNEVKALISFEINPYLYLFPLVQSWPVESRTAETVLVKDDGSGNALFINTLRHIRNPALSFVIDKNNSSLLAVQAVNGMRGIVEGTDYRGVEVLGFISAIEGTNWFMIAKIDKDEAYADLNYLTLWFFGIVLLILLIFVYVFSYNYKKERAKYFEDLYRVESEKKTLVDNYKYVIENANDAMIMSDLKGKIIDANGRAVSLYQYKPEEILVLSVTDLQADDKKKELTEYLDHVTHENGHIFETYGRKKDGTVFPIESSSRLIEINGDKFIQSIIRDITIKKRAHDLLVESEQRFSLSFHNNPAWLTIMNMDNYKVIEVNDAWCRTFGFRRNEAVGKSVMELGIYDEQTYKNIVNELREKKSVKNVEVVVKIRTGDVRTLLVSRELLVINNVPHLYAMGLDITERKKAENELKERELLFRTTLYSIGDGVITTDEKGLLQKMNIVAEKMIGWTEKEAAGRKLTEVFNIVNEETNEIVENPVDKVLKEGLVVGLANHTLLISKDGKKTPIADSGAPIKTDSGDIIGVVLVFRDQTEERSREDALRLQENRFRSLFENTLEGIAIHEVVYDKDGKAVNYKILEVNNNFSSILGIDKSKAKNIPATELYGTPEAPYLEVYSKVAESGRPYSFEVYFEPLKKHFAISVFSPQKGMFATAFTDITGRKIASEALRLNEERYRRISAVISDIAYSCVEENGVFMLDWMAGGVEQLTGFSLDEVVNNKCWKFLVLEEDGALFEANVARLAPGNTGKTDLRIKRKNGEIIWVQSYAECLLEPDGRKRIYGGILDVSDRKKAEDAIRETETMFSRAFRNSPNAMMISSASDNKIVDANDIMIKDSGYSLEELVGKTSAEVGAFVNNSDRDKLVKEVLSKGYARNVESSFKTKSGEILPGLISMSYFYMRGKPYFLSTIVNLREIKNAEELLKKSEEKYRRLHESITDAVIVVDMNGNIIEWNSAYRDMLGYSEDELRRLTYVDITPDNWHEFETKIVNEKIIPLGDSGVYQKEYRKKDGTIFPIELRTFLIRNDKGEPSAMWAVIRDITERKEFEQALIQAKEKAEEMNKLKSNFLANMSHELRTPMTGILGFSEMLSEELQEESKKQMAEVIYQGGKRLMNTLNLILNLSKLESETLTINLQPVNLSELSVSTVKMYEVFAASKNLNLIVDVESDIYALADEQYVSQVISNLIQNAITYTNSGFVSLSLKREITDSGRYAVIKVKDTGIGIKKEYHGIIFEPFRQVSEGFNRSHEGTGLGLTISKKYVDLMNGSISIDSEQGKGTEFTIKFNMPENVVVKNNDHKVMKSETTSANHNGGKYILVVEDDESNAKALEVALRDIAAVDFAGNGEDALEMVNRKKYSLIVMDIGLPGISGLEAVKEIRKKDKYKSVPIIAVSAYAMAGDREIFLSGGCSHYISKPFSIIELRDIVNKLMKDGKSK